MNTQTVFGTIVEGHRVASRPSQDYPYGTLEKQKPLFKALGLDLDRFYTGTLNVSIAPLTFAVVHPEFTFRRLLWTDLHPPEDFSFSRCRVKAAGEWCDGMLYYPHPETKKRNFQNDSILEIMAEYIPEVGYGGRVEVELNADEIHIVLKSNGPESNRDAG